MKQEAVAILIFAIIGSGALIADKGIKKTVKSINKSKHSRVSVIVPERVCLCKFRKEMAWGW